MNYILGYSLTKLARSVATPAEDSAIYRLERGEGTEADLCVVAGLLFTSGQSAAARELLALLTP